MATIMQSYLHGYYRLGMRGTRDLELIVKTPSRASKILREMVKDEDINELVEAIKTELLKR